MSTQRPNTRQAWPIITGRLLPTAEANAPSRQKDINGDGPAPPPDPPGACALVWNDCTTNANAANDFQPAITLAACRAARDADATHYGQMTWQDNETFATTFEGNEVCGTVNQLTGEALSTAVAQMFVMAQDMVAHYRGAKIFMSFAATPVGGPQDPVFTWSGFTRFSSGAWDADVTASLTIEAEPDNWIQYDFINSMSGGNADSDPGFSFGPILITAPDA